MIGLLDCNNFFVSCERLFRPDLIGKPVVVLSSNDGCVVSRSQEVKDMGISMGVPYFQIKDICKKHDITVFSSNFSLYRDISRRVMSAIKEEFSSCEIYSIDEAFVTVPPSYTSAMLLEIRVRIMQKTGIPVSIGCAATKTRAKIATKLAKKGTGVSILHGPEWDDLVKELPCGSVWGIGRQFSSTLSKIHVQTVADFLALDRSYISGTFGVVGERLFLELNGISTNGIGDPSQGQESYTSTRSFSKTIHQKSELLSALCYHVARVGERLRKQECVATRLSIVLAGSRYGDFSHRNSSTTVNLPYPTNDVYTLTKETKRIFDEIYDSEIPYKKAGVVASGILQKTHTSGSLFDDHEMRSKLDTLSAATDVLNQKFGIHMVTMAAMLGKNSWKEQKKILSPEYTTRWKEIATVKAI